MASNNSKNTSFGKPRVGGAIFYAELGTELPTDALTALSDEYENVGYISDEGLENANESSSASITDWGGEKVLEEETDSSETYKYGMIEVAGPAIKQFYGEDNVDVSENGNLKILHNSKALKSYIYVIEILLTGGRSNRKIIPNGKITARENLKYSKSDPIKYGVTISAFPDDDGNRVIEYIEDPNNNEG